MLDYLFDDNNRSEVYLTPSCHPPREQSPYLSDFPILDPRPELSLRVIVVLELTQLRKDTRSYKSEYLTPHSDSVEASGQTGIVGSQEIPKSTPFDPCLGDGGGGEVTGFGSLRSRNPFQV